MPSVSMITTPPRPESLTVPVYAIKELRGPSHRLLWWILLNCEQDKYTKKWALRFGWQERATKDIGLATVRRLREAMLNLVRCNVVARERLRKRGGIRLTINIERLQGE